MSDLLCAPRPAGVWVLGLAGLRGQIARLPLSFGRPYLAVCAYLTAMTTVGLVIAGPGSQRFSEVLMLLPPSAHSVLRGTLLALWLFLPAALALPTMSPSRGRSNYLTQLPLGPRQTGLALCFPLALALTGLIAVLTPALLASAVGTPAPQLTVQVVVICLAAGSAALLLSHMARMLVRRGVLPSLGHSGVSGLAAILVVGLVILGLRAGFTGDVPVLLALGDQSGADLAMAAAVSVLLVGLAADFALRSVALPRTGSAFGPAAWSFLLAGSARPDAFHLVRGWRSPRVQEFRHVAALMIVALVVMGRGAPSAARPVHAENLLLVVGATALVLASLSMAVVRRHAGLDTRVLAAVSVLAVLWTAALGTLCLAVLEVSTQTPKLAMLIVTTAVVAPLAGVLGAILLPSGNLRTQYDAASLAASGAGLVAIIWAWSKGGIPDSATTSVAGVIVLASLFYLISRFGVIEYLDPVKFAAQKKERFQTMKTNAWRLSGFVGFLIGLAICFGLVLGHAMSSRGQLGEATTEFFGIPVLHSVKSELPSGTSTASMAPTTGMLVPLLLPVAVLMPLGFVMRRRAGRTRRPAASPA